MKLYFNCFQIQGLGESDEDSAAIRTNHPIPSQCVLFYFEVEIIDKGKNGYVIIRLDFFILLQIESICL